MESKGRLETEEVGDVSRKQVTKGFLHHANEYGLYLSWDGESLRAFNRQLMWSCLLFGAVILDLGRRMD